MSHLRFNQKKYMQMRKTLAKQKLILCHRTHWQAVSCMGTKGLKKIFQEETKIEPL